MSNAFEIFKDDPKDRKRRFLRGLNYLLGNPDLEDENITIREAINFESCKGILGLRARLANIYCLEFTKDELMELILNNTTARDFTEKYVKIIYEDRGNIGLNSLINNSLTDGAVDMRKMDTAPKYGLNGSQWCDVAEGPCSCGAWH